MLRYTNLSHLEFLKELEMRKKKFTKDSKVEIINISHFHEI